MYTGGMKLLHESTAWVSSSNTETKLMVILWVNQDTDQKSSYFFLELSCRSCLYIFEISSLSVASFAIIFSHSEGCLFTLLIVSFVVHKLLILIRPHLFMFAFISNILGGGS